MLTVLVSVWVKGQVCVIWAVTVIVPPVPAARSTTPGVAEAAGRIDDRAHAGVADVSKARKMIHWNPSISLEEGIPMLIDDLKCRGADFRQMYSEQACFNWE